MKAVYCPYCGGRTKRNGRTSSGSQRWRCTACGASTTVRYDDTATRLDEFLGWLLSKDSQAAMPGGGRSFRRRTAEFWEVWPMPVPDGELHRVSSLSSLVSAGTLFTYLDPALAKAGPLPSTNNMIEGGVNSQLRAVLRNHRGLTSVKRVKAVFWWCHAHSGDARTAREKLAAMPTDADIDFLFSVYSASPSREDGGPEWGDRAVWEDLHHRDPYPFWLD